MRILVTGFEPFGHDSENASGHAVALLAAQFDEPGVQLVTGELQVRFGTAGTQLRELVARYRPDAVLCVGEAGRRTDVSIERRGVNRMDARIPDNGGLQPRGQAIYPNGPKERPATLDVEQLALAVQDAGVAASVSDDAGLYVCNYVAYVAAGLEVPAAFVHVPALRTAERATVGAETDAGTADGASRPVSPLSFDDLVTALRACVLNAAAQVRSRGH